MWLYVDERVTGLRRYKVILFTFNVWLIFYISMSSFVLVFDLTFQVDSLMTYDPYRRVRLYRGQGDSPLTMVKETVSVNVQKGYCMSFNAILMEVKKKKQTKKLVISHTSIYTDNPSPTHSHILYVKYFSAL